ncbi:3-hydroxyisobutyrate dehydrogenase, NAD-binding domain [Phytophthora cactorum]|nr:3-hydroxyisobutyrate dehydrogenase, NAD-binding domain [Phytophthora cactorum]
MRAVSSTRSPLLYASAAMRRMITWSSHAKQRVGFIGLGQMGGRMADNLRKHGHKLVVCDPVPANVQRQVDQGAKAAANAREVAEQCDTIITMLPSTATVECVYLGEDGVTRLYAASICCWTRARSTRSSPRSSARSCTTAARRSWTPQCLAAWRAMGKNLVHCGGSSTGQIAKLCNNLAAAIQLTSIAEATNLGVALGVDPKILAENHPYPGIIPDIPASKGYEGGFAVQFMRKDLGLASSCAMSAEVSAPLTNSVLQLFNMMVNQGNGHKDFAYILPFLKGGNSDHH